ncbi:hypothetical protein PP935_gp168 [Rhizobium phage RHph_N34]|uniref:Uncharacterized protein n=1 Tax=Rhizobium phage RHph_N34 TaxID=2509586 RepID=A0A7S5UZZ9_9CAUD|nr:hypothetical protein PP935_gp168 [Rhizobium phage RHph_N34]QIG73943.1 hypothetical protein EVC06_168 [Rhizobium phage RHph_N34]
MSKMQQVIFGLIFGVAFLAGGLFIIIPNQFKLRECAEQNNVYACKFIAVPKEKTP